MKKTGYLVILIAILVLAFGSISLAQAKPNAARKQAQGVNCPQRGNGAAEQGLNCPGQGKGAGKQQRNRAGNCGTGECGMGNQAGPRAENCPNPGAGECNGPCGQ